MFGVLQTKKDMKIEPSLSFARELDAQDPLAEMRSHFGIPKQANGEDEYYFTGNSPGLQPKPARQYVIDLLDDWLKPSCKNGGVYETKYNPHRP